MQAILQKIRGSRDPNALELCKCGEAREEESYLISGNCEVYGEIRHNYSNLNDDKQLVDFFNEVLSRRDELEEKEKSENKED